MKNLLKEEALRNHPLVKAMPFARHAVHVQLKGAAAGEAASIVIVDPTGKLSPRLESSLLEAASLVELLIGLQQKARIHEFEGRDGRLSIRKDPSAAGSVVSFLDETLVRARRLKTRQDLSYLTLRHWRSQLKPYQIKALRALKLAPPDSLVELISNEMFEVIATLVGDARFDQVVAVPCSHSSPDACLSQKIAASLAARIGARHTPALEIMQRKGSSHPRKNAVLPPMHLTGALSGRCILVDDVATTGTHLYEAASKLKEGGAEVVALAWIG